MTRSRKSSSGVAAGELEPPMPSLPPVSAPTGRNRALVAGAALALWTIALLAMALRTANPPVISRDQIVKADAVVVARRDQHKSDQLRVERVLSGNLAVDDVITVLNWRDATLPEVTKSPKGRRDNPELPQDASYIVPLSRFRQDYVVTYLEGPPLVYRSDKQFLDPIRTVLREIRR